MGRLPEDRICGEDHTFSARTVADSISRGTVHVLLVHSLFAAHSDSGHFSFYEATISGAAHLLRIVAVPSPNGLHKIGATLALNHVVQHPLIG